MAHHQPICANALAPVLCIAALLAACRQTSPPTSPTDLTAWLQTAGWRAQRLGSPRRRRASRSLD